MALDDGSHETDDLHKPIIQLKKTGKKKLLGKRSSSQKMDKDSANLSEGQPKDEKWPNIADLSWGAVRRFRYVRKNSLAKKPQFVQLPKGKTSKQNLFLDVLPSDQESAKLSEQQPRDEIWPNIADLSWGAGKRSRYARKNALAEEPQSVQLPKGKTSKQNLFLDVLPNDQVKLRVPKKE